MTVTAQLAGDHSRTATQATRVPGNQPASGQRCTEAQAVGAAGNPIPGVQLSSETHARPDAGDRAFFLGMAAETLTDIEKCRVAIGNRLKAMEKQPARWNTPEREVLQGIHRNLKLIEKEADRATQQAMKDHPLGPWVKEITGVGYKQAARLLAAVGDPLWNAAHARPRRGPYELYAYCGYAPDQKRRRGVQSNWNAEAKMRAFLIADQCVMYDGVPDKFGRRRGLSPYRAVYDKARANWADRDTSDGHKHNHALRVTAKAILKDLFFAAKEATP